MALREWCKRLTDWWFSSESFDPMGIIRLVFVGAVALPRLDDDLERLAQAASYPAGLIDPPTIINVLPFAFPLSPEAIALLGALMHGALILAFVGLLTRPALLFASLAYLYVGAAAAAMGTFNHALSLIVMVLLVAAVAPGSDAWSLDRLLRALLQGKRTLRECMSFLAMPSTSGWGPRLLLALVATIYLGAGLSKLRYGNGLGWADGETLAFYLKGGSDARHQQFTGPENAPSESAWKDGFGLTAYLYTTASTEHGRLVASQRWLTRLFSLLTLVFELAFPLVFLGGAWRTLLLLIAVAFHACSEHLMLVHFGPYMWLGLLLIDWSAVWRFFRRQKSLPTPAGRVAYR